MKALAGAIYGSVDTREHADPRKPHAHAPMHFLTHAHIHAHTPSMHCLLPLALSDLELFPTVSGLLPFGAGTNALVSPAACRAGHAAAAGGCCFFV